MVEWSLHRDTWLSLFQMVLVAEEIQLLLSVECLNEPRREEGAYSTKSLLSKSISPPWMDISMDGLEMIYKGYQIPKPSVSTHSTGTD